MSRLSPEQVVIGIAPERLTALRLRGGLRPGLLDRHAVPVADAAGAKWDQPLLALDALLAETGWRGHDITVILSGHYVRHAIVPPAGELAAAEVDRLARAVFDDVFGELAQDWELRVSPAPAGARALAAGVPRALLAALREHCAERGRLQAIRPCLMPVFNRVRRHIGAAAACIALVEPGRVTLASVADEDWQYVDSRAGGGNILPQLLLEEGALHERQPGGILWLCDLLDSTRPPADSLWTCRRIALERLRGFVAPPGLARDLAAWGAT